MTIQRDNEFWRFSLAVYAEGEVAQECLALQAALDIDVNVLLFCAWAGAHGAALAKADIEAASNTVRAWQEKVVSPLRSVRRELKPLGSFENFRPKVKEIELEAEQIEQAMLFAWWRSIEKGRTKTGAHDAIEYNVKEYIAMNSGGTQTAVSAPRLVDATRRANRS